MMFNRTYHIRAERQAMRSQAAHAMYAPNVGGTADKTPDKPTKRSTAAKPAAKPLCVGKRTPLQGFQLELQFPAAESPAAKPSQPLADLFPEAYEDQPASR